jgi:hypothetical protein
MVPAAGPEGRQERSAMKRLFKPLLPLFVAVAAGCGVGPHVDDYNESLVASWHATCTCDGWKPQYSSEAECRAGRAPDAAEQACVEALFKNIDGDYEPHLDCRTAAQNRYTGCLNSKSCTDLARLGCLGDYLDEVEDCPDLPSDVDQELAECLN